MKKLEVKQTTNYKGNNWWQWSVELEGPKGELDKVEYVEYTLHPTFQEPVRRVTDSSTNFRLDESGRGEFMIYALVSFKDGETLMLEHWLDLTVAGEGQAEGKGKRQTGEKRAVSTKERPKVFLSCGLTDVSLARMLTRTLEADGIEVSMSGNDVNELPWEASVKSLLDGADGACFILSDRPNTWVMRELMAAEERSIPITPVIVLSSQKFEIPEPMNKFQSIRIKQSTDAEIEKAMKSLAKRLKSNFGINTTAREEIASGAGSA